MTEQSTLAPRPAIERITASSEPRIRLTVGRERLRRRVARRIAGWAGLLLVGYWLVAFALTHVPMPIEQRPPIAIPHADKLAHLSIYTGLSLLLSVWFGVRKRVGGAVLVAAAVLVVLAGYAGFDELSQAPVGRDPDVRDWFADLAGIHLGLFGFLMLRHWVRR